MKSRLIWIAVIALALGGFYYTTIRPALTPTPPPLNKRLSKEYQPPVIPPPPLPEPKFEMPSVPLPSPGVINALPVNSPARRDDPRPAPLEVPIQDGKTIDFSPGAPVVRSQGKDQEALDKALREMAEAAKDITFPPSAAEKK